MSVTYDNSCVIVAQHFHASWDSKVLAQAVRDLGIFILL